MKAVVFHSIGDIRLDEVPDPQIEQPTDAIVRLTASAILRNRFAYRAWHDEGHETRNCVGARRRGDRSGSGKRCQELEQGRSRGDSINNCLRLLLLLSGRLLLAMRQLESKRT